MSIEYLLYRIVSRYIGMSILPPRIPYVKISKSINPNLCPDNTFLHLQYNLSNETRHKQNVHVLDM